MVNPKDFRSVSNSWRGFAVLALALFMIAQYIPSSVFTIFLIIAVAVAAWKFPAEPIKATLAVVFPGLIAGLISFIRNNVVSWESLYTLLLSSALGTVLMIGIGLFAAGASRRRPS